ncbi:MAG: DUF61 family protein [Thermoplasmatota archaeon]
MDERVMDRWFALEMRGLQQGLVRTPRLLQELLVEGSPTAPTGDGIHRFDPKALRALADRLTLLTAHTLRLPILVFVDREMNGSAYVLDRAAHDALRELGLTISLGEGNRGWASETLLRQCARDFPGCFQFLIV